MTKCIAVAAVAFFLVGCQESKTESAYKYKQPITSNGEFQVLQKNLPPKVVELGSVLECLPSISSDAEFRSLLTSNGLNQEPDWYKDFAHFWYLDEALNSETDPQKRMYRIAIGHLPAADSHIIFTFASIERLLPNEPREWLWKIDWPIEPVN